MLKKYIILSLFSVLLAGSVISVFTILTAAALAAGSRPATVAGNDVFPLPFLSDRDTVEAVFLMDKHGIRSYSLVFKYGD